MIREQLKLVPLTSWGKFFFPPSLPNASIPADTILVALKKQIELVLEFFSKERFRKLNYDLSGNKRMNFHIRQDCHYKLKNIELGKILATSTNWLIPQLSG